MRILIVVDVLVLVMLVSLVCVDITDDVGEKAAQCYENAASVKRIVPSARRILKKSSRKRERQRTDA